MKKVPLVSVVIPCYNHSQYLSECLNSLLVQSFEKWEGIIVNDGSTDNTRDVVKDYLKKDSRISYYEQENKGPSAARNRGIKLAKGKYILPLDGDDKIEKEYLRLGVDYMESNKGVDLLYCVANYFGLQSGLWYRTSYSYPKLLVSNMIFSSSFLKKERIMAINGYDELMLDGYEDWEFLIRYLTPTSKIHVLNYVGFYYRKSTYSHNTKFNNLDLHQRTRRYMLSKNIHTYLEVFPDLPNYIAIAQVVRKNFLTKVLFRIMKWF